MQISKRSVGEELQKLIIEVSLKLVADTLALSVSLARFRHDDLDLSFRHSPLVLLNVVHLFTRILRIKAGFLVIRPRFARKPLQCPNAFAGLRPLEELARGLLAFRTRTFEEIVAAERLIEFLGGNFGEGGAGMSDFGGQGLRAGDFGEVIERRLPLGGGFPEPPPQAIFLARAGSPLHSISTKSIIENPHPSLPNTAQPSPRPLRPPSSTACFQGERGVLEM